MTAAGIPTARARVASSPAEAEAALREFGAPYVVKDDALAAGKGVVVTEDRAAALAHAGACGRVVIEEYLDGPEVSLFAVADGLTAVPLLAAQDFKRAQDGDRGPNTGGMGAYSPLPWAPAGLARRGDGDGGPAGHRRDGAARHPVPHAGLLYAGLALTAKGVKVVEFNARFGDPEAQVVLDRLATPLAGLLHASAAGRPQGTACPRSAWHPGAAVTVVIVPPPATPRAPAKGDVITLADPRCRRGGTGGYLLHVPATSSPAAMAPDLVTAGGRVLNAVGTGPDLALARAAAYAVAGCAAFRGGWYRHDIAERAASGS